MKNLDPESRALLALLSTGGWANYWSGPDLPAVWWYGGNPPPYPDNWPSIYFSVNPRTTRLTGRRRGGLTDVVGVNCLYSELDEKDGRTWADITRLDPQPTATVRSGGGWHCYWLLAQGQPVNDGNRAHLNQVQAAWVRYTNGDPGAADLARVLRVPGSLNQKYAPPRRVELLKFEPERVYELSDLEKLIPGQGIPSGGLESGGLRGVGRLPCNPNGARWLARALDRAHVGNRAQVAFWLACQLRDDGISKAGAESILQQYQEAVTNTTNPYTQRESLNAVKQAYRGPVREPAKGSI